MNADARPPSCRRCLSRGRRAERRHAMLIAPCKILHLDMPAAKCYGCPQPAPLNPHPLSQFKIKKQNWVEANEIAREYQYRRWVPNSTNILPLTLLLVGFPMVYHYLVKHELELRDVKMNKFETPRKMV